MHAVDTLEKSHECVNGKDSSSAGGRKVCTMTPEASSSHAYLSHYEDYGVAPRLEELPRTARDDDEYYEAARRAAEARRVAASIAAEQLASIARGKAQLSRDYRRPQGHNRSSEIPKIDEHKTGENISSL